MNAVVSTAPLSKSQARKITDQINAKSGELWALLKEANDRQAWSALGYKSWRDYAVSEFRVSQSRAYQLLDQAGVVTAIQEAANSTMVEISERAAREIKPVIKEVTKEIKAKVAAGGEPIKTTYAVIEAKREELKISTSVAKADPALAKQVAHGEVTLPAAVEQVTGKRPGARKPEPAPMPANDDHDGPDLSELVDELQAENTRLIGVVKAAEADDLKAEAVKWRSAYDRAVAAQSEAMDAAHASQKREKFSMTQLRRCGKAVGEDDPRKIAAAVEAMARRAAECK